MTRTRKLEIQKIARCALLDHDRMVLPVRPKKFAEEKLKMMVMDFDPPEPSISGFLMQSGNEFGIGFSTAIKNEGFQNFTVAHELGHYFIDGHAEELLRDGEHFSRSGFISTDPREREADVFATEFLMPWKLIGPLVNGGKNGFTAIKELSDQCESSLVASAIRFTEITKGCAAVVISHRGIVEFMVASEAFRQIPGIEWHKRGDRLPSKTPSTALSDDQDWIRTCGVRQEGARLSDWFSAAPNLEVEEDVVGLGSYGRLMTVLITDWSEDEQEDETDDDDWIERWNEGRFRARK